MYAVYRTTNTIILYLILSTISIFIPVSGGVGRGQVHCFAQGGGAIMLLRRPWIRGIVRLIWSVRTQLLAENGLWNADLRFGSGNICNPSPPHPNARFWMLRVYPMCVVMLSLCQIFLNRGSNKDTCMSKPGFRVTVTLATLGVMWIRCGFCRTLKIC
jgi:hypothetical protein